MIFVVFALLFLALLFGPQIWVRQVIANHSDERSDFPGTGGELARHLLDEAGLEHGIVEAVPAGQGGDH